MELKSVGFDKKGNRLYSRNDCEKIVVKYIKSKDRFFYRKAKSMTQDLIDATELTSVAVSNFSDQLNKLIAVENNFSALSKRASGSVRDAADKLANGLSKIEKSANFDRLENYVSLLERAASAMNTLAELEKNGKLEKIALAIK